MVEGCGSAAGTVAGRYRLLEVVHRETNQVCWSGEDLEAERPRLLTQILLPDGTDRHAARRITARVLRTAEAVRRLRPGRVATVVDAVTEAGTLWTVTERIDGLPLGELLDVEGPVTYMRAARIGLELLDVLDAAHAQGITHGELGPGQVFVHDQGGIVLTGFGLAGATLAPRLTAPAYAAPEQARDERIGPASDLWALGALLYRMVEGRPPYRDRGRSESTLRSVDRLPLDAPQRAGSLTRAVEGLLRKDSRERLPRGVVREVLTRVLDEDPDAVAALPPRPRLRGAYAAARKAGREWGGRAMAVGTTLAVVTVTVAVLAVTHQSPGAGSSGSASPGGASGGEDTGRAPSARPTTSAPSGTATALPAGFRRYDAPEGFSLALPTDWRRQGITRAPDGAYRVDFGASGDARHLAVTYTERVDRDPVAVWRDDVEPGLRQRTVYRRVGDIRATSYQGFRAADMEWLAGSGDRRVRTFGRGFRLGGERGFSLRWTTPADAFAATTNRQVLRVLLQTFDPGRV
ncbi:serine/threonine-protein kinase [Streptomyces endophyticus]|uniref:non-specific serine/threonine protein kinase n=1 Tax=Streptomyces endophyticus TaxID=714166 RepID=A0ABU6F8I8_9ACTN|nr:serine/threonine-protein kinase [Streptomyces endophyticus]MEB8340328.1 serine/threonine protein kinase [Streptomyces endophyticus]